MKTTISTPDHPPEEWVPHGIVWRSWWDDFTGETMVWAEIHGFERKRVGPPDYEKELEQ